MTHTLDELYALDLLLWLRYAEILVLIGAIYWVIWTMKACPYRTKRLVVAFGLLSFNIAAILVRIVWLKLPPW